MSDVDYDKAFEDIDEFDTSNLDFGNDFGKQEELDLDNPNEEPPAEEPPAEEPLELDDDPEDVDPELPADEPAAKDIRIPKSRLDGEIAKRRKAEDEARQLKEFIQRLTAPAAPTKPEEPQVSIDDLIKAEHEALIEGDMDKALNIRKQAMEMERQTYSREVMTQVQSVDSNIKDELMFNQRLSQVVTEYPLFDETSESYDENLARAALQLGNSYVAQGYSRAQALDMTIETLSPALKLVGTPKPAAPAAPAKAAAPRNLDAKIRTAKTQPPRTSGSGSNRSEDPVISPNQMSVDEWEALPDSARAKFLV